MQCISHPEASVGRVRIGQAPMGHVSGLRGFYPGYVPKSGFRGPYGACARPQRSLPETYVENVAQTGIGVSWNYFALHLRKIKLFWYRPRSGSLEINEKILSQGSNLESDRIIFDKLANYLRSEAFQRVVKLVSFSKNQRDIILSGYHWAIRPKLKEGFEGIALYARFPLF